MEASDTFTVVEMRNVHFRVDRELTLQIHRLQGRLRPTSGHAIIDDDPADPFDFFLQEYMAQLVAGRSHAGRSQTMSDAGLATYFPDYGDISGTTD